MECQLCKGIANDTWSLEIRDDKKRVTLSGHYKCIVEIESKIKKLDSKLNINQVLKKLNLEV